MLRKLAKDNDSLYIIYKRVDKDLSTTTVAQYMNNLTHSYGER